MRLFPVNFKKFSRLNIAISTGVTLAVLIVGYSLLISRAGGPFASLEAEQAQPSSSAQVINDAAASAGKALAFGSAVTPPPPIGDCKTKVWQTLEACGWPGPGNTGYPAGASLRSTNARTISTDNTVIDGEKITGGLEIAAKNVTIRNSWLTKFVAKGEAANASGVIKLRPGASATIHNTTLDGQKGTHTCIWHEGTSLTAYRNNCFGANDGMFSWKGDNIVLVDNYIHNLSTETSNGHVDGFQTEGAANNTSLPAVQLAGYAAPVAVGTIRHNTIDIAEEQTSAIAIWNSLKSSSNFTIDNNLLAGGGFTIYAQDYNPSESSPSGGFTVTNIRFTNNKFSRVHFGCVGFYGVWYPRGNPSDAWQRSGNVVLETDQNIDSGNPSNNGRVCN